MYSMAFAQAEAEARYDEYERDMVAQAQATLDTELALEVEGSLTVEVLSWDNDKVEILTTVDTVYGPPIVEEFYGTVAEYLAQVEARRDAYLG